MSNLLNKKAYTMAVEISGLVPPIIATRAEPRPSSAASISADRGTTTKVTRERLTGASTRSHSMTAAAEPADALSSSMFHAWAAVGFGGGSGGGGGGGGGGVRDSRAGSGVGGLQQWGTEVEQLVEMERSEVVSAKQVRHRLCLRPALPPSPPRGGECPRLMPTVEGAKAAGRLPLCVPLASSCSTSPAGSMLPSHVHCLSS